MDEVFTLSLNREEFAQLLLALGAAAGLAAQNENVLWLRDIGKLINRIGALDPTFKPYKIREK